MQNVYICPKQHQAKHIECEESLFRDLIYPRFLNKQLMCKFLITRRTAFVFQYILISVWR